MNLIIPPKNDGAAVDIASQAEAEAGVENTKMMTALRVLQSIEANVLANMVKLPNATTVLTSNIVLIGEQTQNGVALVENDLVLLAGQTDQTENGPYIVGAGVYGAWTRPAWFAVGSEAFAKLIYAELGTTNAETFWLCINDEPCVVDTDDQSWLNLTEAAFDINALTAESVNSGDDLIAIYDVSAGVMRKQTRTEFLAGVSGGTGVADTRTITAGTGLSGGGDLSDDRTIDLDINELTAEATADDNDLIAIYDNSSSSIKKQSRADFLSGVGGGGDVSSTLIITAGIGLSGGGDLSDNRTIDLDLNGLDAFTQLTDEDYVLVYDTSSSTHKKQLRSVFLNGLASAGRNMIAGKGLTGGGNLDADRTFTLAVNDLIEASGVSDLDYIAIYDDSASATLKQSRADFLSGLTLAGSVPFTGQLVYSDYPIGTITAASIAAPQISMEHEEDCGFFFGDSGICGISVNGAAVLTCTASQVQIKQDCVFSEVIWAQDRIDAQEIRLNAQSADPVSAVNSLQIWMSDGTGYGDNGDLMVWIHDGTTSKVIKLVDFSEVTSL